MAKWIATLENGEVVEESELGSWRMLAERCDSEGLSITSLKYNGEEVNPKAQWYFVIHDIFVVKGGKADGRKGLGSIIKGGSRYRIKWVESSIPSRNYDEVRKGVPTFYKELAIPVMPKD
jgi:hypothetical protein